MKKADKRQPFYDLLADEFTQVLRNLLEITNEESVSKEQVTFQLGRLNEIHAFLNEAENNTDKDLSVTIGVTIREKKVSR